MNRKQRDEFKHQFNRETQILILGYMMSSPDIFTRVRTIIKDDYFDDTLALTARFILEYADEYRVLPELDLVRAKTGTHLTTLSDEAIEKQKGWLLNEIESFCKYRAMENTIIDGYDHLRNGDTGRIWAQMQEAMTISLVSDLGTNYFLNPAERLKQMLDRSNFVSTGWPSLDGKLFGGLGKGELNIFCGGSGSGKSLFLQNLALNWVKAGYIVLYFTLELSESLVSLRLDSMISEMPTKQVVRNISDVALRIGMMKALNRLYIKKLPESGTTVNGLRAFLKEFEIQTGKRPNAIIVDYLDLLYPNDQRLDISNLFTKDKYVSEELRGLMGEGGYFGATASQLNRGSVQAQGQLDHSHIAGGLSKIQTADNVFAITSSPQRGEYDLLLLKTRSSSGNGQHVRLQYNDETMRISDDLREQPEADQTVVRSSAEIYADLHEQPEPEDDDILAAVKGSMANRHSRHHRG